MTYVARVALACLLVHQLSCTTAHPNRESLRQRHPTDLVLGDWKVGDYNWDRTLAHLHGYIGRSSHITAGQTTPLAFAAETIGRADWPNWLTYVEFDGNAHTGELVPHQIDVLTMSPQGAIGLYGSTAVVGRASETWLEGRLADRGRRAAFRALVSGGMLRRGLSIDAARQIFGVDLMLSTDVANDGIRGFVILEDIGDWNVSATLRCGYLDRPRAELTLDGISVSALRSRGGGATTSKQ